MNRQHRSSPFGRYAGRELPFSSRLESLEDIPLAFKKTVSRFLEGREQTVRHIIVTPEFGTFGEYCPATLFIVTDKEWLAFATESSGAPTVRYSDFKQTRFIESTLALLQGRLVLEFGDAGEPPCVLRFSLTSWDIFRDALFVILSEGALQSADDSMERKTPAAWEELSFGMRSTLHESILPDDEVRDLIAWSRSDVSSSSDRMEIHPGGIVLTDHYLCVITADDPSDREGAIDLSVYNRGVAFLNRRFPIVARTIAHDGTDEMEIKVGGANQESTVAVLVPRTYSAAVGGMIATLGIARTA